MPRTLVSCGEVTKLDRVWNPTYLIIYKDGADTHLVEVREKDWILEALPAGRIDPFILHPLCPPGVKEYDGDQGAPEVFIKHGNLPILLHHQDLSLQIRVLREVLVYEYLSKDPHPNICGYHGVVVEDGYIQSIALEKAAFELKQYREHKWMLKEYGDWKEQLKSAVEHLHKVGLAWGDLKFDNIGFRADHTLMIYDFDMSARLGTVMPTPIYGHPAFFVDAKMLDEQHGLAGLRLMDQWVEAEIARWPDHSGRF